MRRYPKSARPVMPMRIFVPTDEENTPVRDDINREVYCSVESTRKSRGVAMSCS
jgi:hypothetical protein